MARARRGTLYTGVTSDLVGRVYKHKNEITEGFTSKYNVKNLVYYEFHGTMEEAIIREKKIKKWKREYKYNIIEEGNPNWEDLYERLLVKQ